MTQQPREIVETLDAILSAHPELRLGELLIRAADSRPLFPMSDAELTQRCVAYVEKLDAGHNDG